MSILWWHSSPILEFLSILILKIVFFLGGDSNFWVLGSYLGIELNEIKARSRFSVVISNFSKISVVCWLKKKKSKIPDALLSHFALRASKKLKNFKKLSLKVQIENQKWPKATNNLPRNVNVSFVYVFLPFSFIFVYIVCVFNSSPFIVETKARSTNQKRLRPHANSNTNSHAVSF